MKATQHVVALLAEGNTGDGFESGVRRARQCRHVPGCAAAPRADQPGARGTLAFSRGFIAGDACRRVARHGAALRHRSSSRTSTSPIAGVRKSFTSLPDEFLFIDENTRGILLLQRRRTHLTKVVPLGVSSPVADVLFAAAQATRLQRRHRVQRNGCSTSSMSIASSSSVRPYYKPYRVGRQEYRGANAGDFSGINEIDLLLGLCRANDPYYAQLLVDKMLFMLPRTRRGCASACGTTSLLDELLALAASTHARTGSSATRAAISSCATCSDDTPPASR